MLFCLASQDMGSCFAKLVTTSGRREALTGTDPQVIQSRSFRVTDDSITVDRCH